MTTMSTKLQLSYKNVLIVLFNIQDRNDAEHGLNLVKEILNSIGINTINIRVRRIGRAVRDRPRAVVDTLSSRAEVLLVLRSRRTLPADISVSEDRTRVQRDNYSALRQRVREHNQGHPQDQWRIKFVNNSPTIVSVKDSKPISKNE